MTKSRGILKRQRAWSEIELKILVDNYADAKSNDIARALGRPLDGIYRKAYALGLKKSAEFLASDAACRIVKGYANGIRFGFEKGHVPANKGLRRPGFSVGRGRMQETQFKPGQSKSRMPLGSTRINADGYLDRKLAETGYPPVDWKCVHRLLWIGAHGPIPAGHVVRFKPGRRTTVEADITLDSIELITLRENMARNTVHNLPKELAQVAQLRGVLNRQINKRAKRDEQEHQ